MGLNKEAINARLFMILTRVRRITISFLEDKYDGGCVNADGMYGGCVEVIL